jgi:myo-inositol-1(or 4)-monophosphatase
MTTEASGLLVGVGLFSATIFLPGFLQSLDQPTPNTAAHIYRRYRFNRCMQTSSSSNTTSSGRDNDLLTKEEQEIAIVARDAAWKAGAAMLDGLGTIDPSNGIESKIGSRDIVTEVDKRAQELIFQTILAKYPTHKFLGEEDVSPGIVASRQALANCQHEPHLWIVDPVDGTTNFAHGLPLSAVIIAYASHGQVKHGLIYDPYRNETFAAWRGRGAYLNGQRIHCCRHTARMDCSLVATGSPPDQQCLQATLRGATLLSPLVRSLRILGAAAVHLSWVAAGRLTAFFEPDLNAWDLAAGALIIQEAGGRVTDVHGKDYALSTRSAVVSNGLVHDKLLCLLQEARMWVEDQTVEKEDK